ncbi:MAG TPA: aminotransferase class I/II-fold pyridoxal phosphate-dependent enzyme [Kiritimatiellia bacterium]|nr:aminotransferase class I/II-fold pyridoxal phosphate-dependent enzyme [Kiritimatiellia bacterium]HPS06946.1 aminotransferase class I/II-fold pyridoxal phosphate-dependent enzyme [Kiritimatiellia bacterium]
MSKRIYLSPPWMSGCERALVDEAFASGYIAPCGPMVDRFEREFAGVVGIPQACAVSSGTAALDLLFHELGVTKGDRVFCSDLTFVSSIAPAVHRGAEPVFIDCDEATWTMDPDLLEEALADAARTGRRPKAVVAVDLYGQCCDYGRIGPLCAKYGVPLIIDAAEALGALYGSSNVRESVTANGANQANNGNFRSAGNAGWAAVYSFNGNKIITTSGGGMIASSDDGVVARARKRSQQSREPAAWYEHEELGYNYRMSNIVAAIGAGQLQHLDEIVAKKRQIFAWYRQRLGNVAGIGFMPEAAYGRCTRWLTVALLRPLSGRNGECKNGPETEDGKPTERVMRVIEALERENIESRPVWKPMHLQPVFRKAEVVGGGVSARLFENGLCLPSGAGLGEADVDRICGLVARVLG